MCGAFSSPKEIAETILDASGAAAEVMRLLNERLNTYPYSREWPFLSSNDLPPERDVSAQSPRVGVFACTCGGTMGEVLDVPELARQAAGWPGVVHSEVIEFACFPETLDHIQDRIHEHDLNRVVVAACSNRTHESLFQRTIRQAGLNPYLLELVNLQSQCSRPHRWQPELANRKAAEMLRMAVGRVLVAEPVHKKPHRCRPSALDHRRRRGWDDRRAGHRRQRLRRPPGRAHRDAGRQPAEPVLRRRGLQPAAAWDAT